ncbi:hypothetical protein IAU60_005945 [Kwoniella sp. DSM 27419]
MSPSSTLVSTSASQATPTPLASSGEISPRASTPRGMLHNHSDREKEREKGLMLPPPIPVKEVSPAPRMTRLPSLKQLSEHLHYTPSSSSSSTMPSNPLATPKSGSPSSIPATPPSLRISTGAMASTPGPLSGSSPMIAPSPSGRLRLPASAMMRSLSSGSNGGGVGIGTPLETVHSPDWTSRGFGTPGGSAAGLGDALPSPRSQPARRALDTGGSPTGAGPATGLPQTPGKEASPMSRTSSSQSYIQGYSNVPSLDQIRRRVSISQARAAVPTTTPTATAITPVAGATSDVAAATSEQKTSTAVPAAPVSTSSTTATDSAHSPPESTSTASVTSSNGDDIGGRKKEHPLAHAWTLFFDSKSYKPEVSSASNKDRGSVLAEYENTLVTVGKFDTVEGFARHLNNIRLPSLLNKNSNYHMFKNGIRPMWEDPANANGGKWVVLFRSSPTTLDVAWANLTMALVGQVLDEEDQVCGIVASNRPKIDRIQVWTRGREDVNALNRLGRKIAEVMALEGRDAECMSMEFQYNASNSNPPPGRFCYVPFNSRPNPSSTPSRLSVSGSFQGTNMNSGVGLGINASPRSSSAAFPLQTAGTGGRSPTNGAFGPLSTGGGGSLEPPQPPPGFRARLGSGSGSHAFAGPMGMVRSGSTGGSGGSLSPGISPSPSPRPMRAERA